MPSATIVVGRLFADEVIDGSERPQPSAQEQGLRLVSDSGPESRDA